MRASPSAGSPRVGVSWTRRTSPASSVRPTACHRGSFDQKGSCRPDHPSPVANPSGIAEPAARAGGVLAVALAEPPRFVRNKFYYPQLNLPHYTISPRTPPTPTANTYLPFHPTPPHD